MWCSQQNACLHTQGQGSGFTPQPKELGVAGTPVIPRNRETEAVDPQLEVILSFRAFEAVLSYVIPCLKKTGVGVSRVEGLEGIAQICNPKP